jgi:hypothetical protein
MQRLALLGAFLACVGCTPMQFTRFENPIVDESGVRVDPALVGRWVDEGNRDETEVWEITANGALRVFSKLNESGESSRDAQTYELVTAKLGNLTVFSLGGSEDGGSWHYLRYWFPEPNVLSYAPGNTNFWRDSVRNKMVEGTIELRENVEKDATVTASGAELRAFVLGYGSVIFPEPDVEAPRLRRVSDGS